MCSDEQVAEVLKAQNELQQAVDENALAVSKAGGVATTVVAGAIVPGPTRAWSIATAVDYLSDTISYQFGLTDIVPDITKSMQVVGIAAVASPFMLPLNTFGTGTIGKGVVAGGAGAYAGTAMTNPGSSPELAAGLGVGTSGVGSFAQNLIPGPAGIAFGYLFQILPGPMQAAIEKSRTLGGRKMKKIAQSEKLSIDVLALATWGFWE